MSTRIDPNGRFAYSRLREALNAVETQLRKGTEVEVNGAIDGLDKVPYGPVLARNLRGQLLNATPQTRLQALWFIHGALVMEELLLSKAKECGQYIARPGGMWNDARSSARACSMELWAQLQDMSIYRPEVNDPERQLESIPTAMTEQYRESDPFRPLTRAEERAKRRSEARALRAAEDAKRVAERQHTRELKS